MFPAPGVADLIDTARSLGIVLTEEEAPLFLARLQPELAELHALTQLPVDEPAPPLLFPERGPGTRPAAGDDPYGAWLWRCDIGGAEPGTAGLGGDGRLAGRTVSFKDHISVAGVPQCFNSLPMDGFIPSFDATVVTRVLSAGGRVIGKNMMSGFLGGYGRPRNPRDVSRSAGGSSSGSAVAVAAGEVDVSFGGDQGGSIRVPAAYCGVVGLKPTFSLVSHFGVSYGSEPSVDHVGPIARSVAVAAAALEVVAGYDPYEFRTVREVPDHLDATGGLGDSLDGLRIGLLTEGFADPIDPGVRASVLSAVRALEAAGATTQWVCVPEHALANRLHRALLLEGAKAMLDTTLFGMGHETYYPATTIAAVDRMWHEHANDYPPRTKLNHILAAYARRRYHGGLYAKAQNARPAVRAAYDRAFAAVDLLAMPTVRSTAPPADPRHGPAGDAAAEVAANLGRDTDTASWNTRPFDYTGHPALTVPCGDVEGLPAGLQLVGRRFEDALVLRAGHAYELTASH